MNDDDLRARKPDYADSQKLSLRLLLERLEQPDDPPDKQSRFQYYLSLGQLGWLRGALILCGAIVSALDLIKPAWPNAVKMWPLGLRTCSAMALLGLQLWLLVRVSHHPSVRTVALAVVGVSALILLEGAIIPLVMSAPEPMQPSILWSAMDAPSSAIAAACVVWLPPSEPVIDGWKAEKLNEKTSNAPE